MILKNFELKIEILLVLSLLKKGDDRYKIKHIIIKSIHSSLHSVSKKSS